MENTRNDDITDVQIRDIYTSLKKSDLIPAPVRLNQANLESNEQFSDELDEDGAISQRNGANNQANQDTVIIQSLQSTPPAGQTPIADRQNTNPVQVFRQQDSRQHMASLLYPQQAADNRDTVQIQEEVTQI